MTLALWVGKRQLIDHNYTPSQWYRGLLVVTSQFSLVIGKGKDKPWTSGS